MPVAAKQSTISDGSPHRPSASQSPRSLPSAHPFVERGDGASPTAVAPPVTVPASSSPANSNMPLSAADSRTGRAKGRGKSSPRSSSSSMSSDSYGYSSTYSYIYDYDYDSASSSEAERDEGSDRGSAPQTVPARLAIPAGGAAKNGPTKVAVVRKDKPAEFHGPASNTGHAHVAKTGLSAPSPPGAASAKEGSAPPDGANASSRNVGPSSLKEVSSEFDSKRQEVRGIIESLKKSNDDLKTSSSLKPTPESSPGASKATPESSPGASKATPESSPGASKDATHRPKQNIHLVSLKSAPPTAAGRRYAPTPVIPRKAADAEVVLDDWFRRVEGVFSMSNHGDLYRQVNSFAGISNPLLPPRVPASVSSHPFIQSASAATKELMDHVHDLKDVADDCVVVSKELFKVASGNEIQADTHRYNFGGDILYKALRRWRLLGVQRAFYYWCWFRHAPPPQMPTPSLPAEPQPCLECASLAQKLAVSTGERSTTGQRCDDLVASEASLRQALEDLRRDHESMKREMPAVRAKEEIRPPLPQSIMSSSHYEELMAIKAQIEEGLRVLSRLKKQKDDLESAAKALQTKGAEDCSGEEQLAWMQRERELKREIAALREYLATPREGDGLRVRSAPSPPPRRAPGEPRLGRGEGSPTPDAGAASVKPSDSEFLKNKVEMLERQLVVLNDRDMERSIRYKELQTESETVTRALKDLQDASRSYEHDRALWRRERHELKARMGDLRCRIVELETKLEIQEDMKNQAQLYAEQREEEWVERERLWEMRELEWRIAMDKLRHQGRDRINSPKLQ